MRIHYSGDAKPVEAPFPGYDITFSVEHCKVLVYSTKAYDTETPVETLTAKAKNQNGEIVAYDPDDIELQPQVSFKVVCDEGYSCTANNVSVTPVGKFKNIKQNPDNKEGQDDIYRVTKVQDNLTITISPVQGEQEPGYKVTFVPEHCEIKVYVGPKDETGSNLDTPQEGGFYYARTKDAPYDVGYTTPQVNFEVIPEAGYSFEPVIDENSKVDFITHPNAEKAGYNKFSDKGGYYNLTKVDDDLTITVKATKPVEAAQPSGNFSGYFVASGVNVFTHVALANELAYFEMYFAKDNENNITVQKAYTFNAETKQVSIAIDDGTKFGNFTATYDEESKALTNGALSGPGSALLSNNGQASFANASLFYDCEGTADELNVTFARRYRTVSPDAWQNNDLQPVAAETTNVAAGKSAVMVEGSTTYKAVGLVLRNDFAEGKPLKSIGFWVYNSSNTDIKLQSYVYKQTGFGGYESINPVAKANGWTYCRCGFDFTIYNFVLADFTKSGVNLVFDNICLF